MSVLINMEMPTSCYKCHMKQRDGMYIVCPVAHKRFSVADVNILDYRLDNCPIIPVPKHGDLIDRDALLTLCKDYAITRDDDEFCNRLEYALTKAPTVIPAEEDER